jgi:hypothetical protein
VGLRSEVLASLVFDALPIGFELFRVLIVVLPARLCFFLTPLCHFHVCRFLLAFAFSLHHFDFSTRFWTGLWWRVVREVTQFTSLDGIELGAFSWGVLWIDGCCALILWRHIEFDTLRI